MVTDVQRQLGLLREMGKTAHFTTVLVGNDPASKKYIDMKQSEGSMIGVSMARVDLPADISQSDLNSKIAELNNDLAINAILIQYPLPGKLNYLESISQIEPNKDVDGLHPYNLGLIMHDPQGNYPGIIPCTPNGIVQLLEHGGVKLEGADVAVVGRGMTVGAPLSMLLSAKNNGPGATVTTLHRHTKDLSKHIKNADIVIGATGVPNLIDDTMVKQDAILVSVGVSYDSNGRARGDFTDEARKKADIYIPVTGGIGPMTRANLWQNVLKCYELQQDNN